jgi:dTDP-glucose 4,6-dehydratase
MITRASNNFGPYQYPEKVIPLFITNAIEGKSLPLYGDGKNVRDWLYVTDHCKAIAQVLLKGREGEIYNIGGGNEVNNITLTKTILKYLAKPLSLITPVADRPGHDRRYSIDCTKLKNETGCAQTTDFNKALKETVEWYVNNPEWWQKLKDKSFNKYYKKQYKK